MDYGPISAWRCGESLTCPRLSRAKHRCAQAQAIKHITSAVGDGAMKLEDLIETMPTWGLSASVDATQEFFVAPLGAFREQWPELTLTVIPQSLVPEGRPYRRAHIRENAQSFDVVYHQFENYRGLWHEWGANWILW